MGPGHKRRQRGFSLLEIMMAVAFFAIAFVSLSDAYNRGIFAEIYLDRAAMGVNLAQEMLDQIKSRSYASILAGTTTEPAVTGFADFRRVTTVVLTPGVNANSSFKTITITVSWQLKGTLREDYQLRTYIADY